MRLSGLIAGGEPGAADPLADARSRLKRIGQVAQAYLEEKGASTLFLAVGLATWDVPTGAKPNAPVIMLPLSVEPADAAHREFVLEVSGDAHFNPIMAHSLRTDYGLELSDDDFDLEEPPRNFNGMLKLLGDVRENIIQVPGFEVTPRLVVGNFRYNNLPLVADLEQNLEAFARSDLVAAIAGVAEARGALASGVGGPAADLPDTEPPAAEFLVLDADSQPAPGHQLGPDGGVRRWCGVHRAPASRRPSPTSSQHWWQTRRRCCSWRRSRRRWRW